MPTDSDALPDIVLGQANFTGNGYFNTSQRLRSPQHCLFVDDQLLVADTYNHRVMVFNATNTDDALNK